MNPSMYHSRDSLEASTCDICDVSNEEVSPKLFLHHLFSNDEILQKHSCLDFVSTILIKCFRRATFQGLTDWDRFRPFSVGVWKNEDDILVIIELDQKVYCQDSLGAEKDLKLIDRFSVSGARKRNERSARDGLFPSSKTFVKMEGAVCAYHQRPLSIAIKPARQKVAIFANHARLIVSGDSDAFEPLSYISRPMTQAATFVEVAFPEDVVVAPKSEGRANVSTPSSFEYLLNSLITNLANPDTARDTLTTLSHMIVCDRDDRALLSQDKKRLTQLSLSFIELVEDMEISLQFMNIFIIVCEHDERQEGHGLLNLGSCFQTADMRAFLVLCAKHALACHHGELFGKVFRLRQLLSHWSGIRSLDSEQILAVALNGISLITNALRTFKHDPKTIIHVLRGLETYMAGYDQCKMKFSNVDGVQALVEVMRANPLNSEVNEECCRTLDIAAELQSALRPFHLRGTRQACLEILGCMPQIPESSSLMEAGCSFLIKAASSSTGDAEMMNRTGTRDMIQVLQATHGNNASLEVLVNQLLMILNTTGETASANRVNCVGSSDSRERSRGRVRSPRNKVRSCSPSKRRARPRPSHNLSPVTFQYSEEYD